MCKPAPLRCAGLHNLLPVIWRLYFNKLTKLNIQFLKKPFLFSFLLDVMRNYSISSQSLTKEHRPWLKECAYHKIQEYSDQHWWDKFYFINFNFPCKFNAFGLVVISHHLYPCTFWATKWHSCYIWNIFAFSNSLHQKVSMRIDL